MFVSFIVTIDGQRQSSETATPSSVKFFEGPDSSSHVGGHVPSRPIYAPVKSQLIASKCGQGQRPTVSHVEDWIPRGVFAGCDQGRLKGRIFSCLGCNWRPRVTSH